MIVHLPDIFLLVLSAKQPNNSAVSQKLAADLFYIHTKIHTNWAQTEIEGTEKVIIYQVALKRD